MESSKICAENPACISAVRRTDISAELLNDLFNSLSSAGDVIDLQPIFFHFTLYITTSFLFEKSVQSLMSPEGSPE